MAYDNGGFHVIERLPKVSGRPTVDAARAAVADGKINQRMIWN